MRTELRSQKTLLDFLGAHPKRASGRTQRTARVALVLALFTSPAAAQWFDETEPVHATDEAPPPPPPPAAEPSAPPPAAPAPATPSPAPTAPQKAEPAPAGAAQSSAAPAPAAPHKDAAPAMMLAEAPAAEEPKAAPWPLRFRVALNAEVAFGQKNRFRNYLFGPRFDVRFSEQTALGYSVRYANLEGPGDRSHNALHTITLEHRLLPSEGTGFAVPLRLSGGYLPNNGPFLQGAAGLGYVGDKIELLALPVMPTFWNTGNRTWISYDIALEVALRF